MLIFTVDFFFVYVWPQHKFHSTVLLPDLMDVMGQYVTMLLLVQQWLLALTVYIVNAVGFLKLFFIYFCIYSTISPMSISVNFQICFFIYIVILMITTAHNTF